jgi:hypothetical protein
MVCLKWLISGVNASAGISKCTANPCNYPHNPVIFYPLTKVLERVKNFMQPKAGKMEPTAVQRDRVIAELRRRYNTSYPDPKEEAARIKNIAL